MESSKREGKFFCVLREGVEERWYLWMRLEKGCTWRGRRKKMVADVIDL